MSRRADRELRHSLPSLVELKSGTKAAGESCLHGALAYPG